MNLPVIGSLIDERFLRHRLRSSSTAGIACAELALIIFFYRFYTRHVWSWDLVAVFMTFLVVKYALFIWYRYKD